MRSEEMSRAKRALANTSEKLTEEMAKHVPSMDLLDEYQEIGEWCCDYCGYDQVYVGGGRMMCANKDCKNVLGKDGMVEHMTGSYSDMNNLGGNNSYENGDRLWDLIYVFDINLKAILDLPKLVCAECGSTGYNLMFQAWVYQDDVRDFIYDECIDNSYANCKDCGGEVGTSKEQDYKKNLEDKNA